jgi:VRR-NUC domain-containing protein
MSERRLWRLTSPKPESLPPPLERKSQAAVVDWANWAAGTWPALRLLFAVPNAAKREKKTRGLLLAMGMKAGVPDLLLPVPRDGYIGLAIEMKRIGEKASDVQMAWIDALEEQGWRAIVCWGAGEAIEALQGYVSARVTRFE